MNKFGVRVVSGTMTIVFENLLVDADWGAVGRVPIIGILPHTLLKSCYYNQNSFHFHLEEEQECLPG